LALFSIDMKFAVSAALMLGIAALNVSAQPIQMDAGVSRLLKEDRLEDRRNGFSIRLTPARSAWTVHESLGPDFTKYVGINQQQRVIYTVFIDRRRYSEQTPASAARYQKGLLEGYADGGWSVASSTVSSTDVPRRGSFRFVTKATNKNGVTATFIEHVTSPDNLYSLGAVLPEGADEGEFLKFAQTFQVKP
jgi:hypothetical protein